MDSNQFLKSWIAAHLLFPNSAQARDVYLFIITEFESKKYSDSAIFKKIIQIYLKTEIVQSNLSFVEFESANVKYWPLFFKKTNKDERLLILAKMVFGFSLKQLAQIFKLNENQIKNKILKIIYQIIPKPEFKTKASYEFEYKKYDQQNKSDFFIYDELIEQCLNINEIQKSNVVTDGSNQLPLKKFSNQINELKDEFLRLDSLNYEIPKIKKIIKKGSDANKTLLYKVAPVAAVLFLIVGGLIFRPAFIQNRLQIAKDETIEIQQLKIERHIEEKNDIAAVAVSTDSTAVVAKVLPSQPVQTEKAKQPEPILAKVEKKLDAEKKVDQKNKSGGLYRGRLYVTDIQQVISVVKEKIINLGGQKAGEVELGWMKNESTSYFHFSFPDENKADLEVYLKQFGKIELAFEPHPRVMPAGQKRYIIEIKQNE